MNENKIVFLSAWCVCMRGKKKQCLILLEWSSDTIRNENEKIKQTKEQITQTHNRKGNIQIHSIEYRKKTKTKKKWIHRKITEDI